LGRKVRVKKKPNGNDLGFSKELVSRRSVWSLKLESFVLFNLVAENSEESLSLGKRADGIQAFELSQGFWVMSGL
jgi:hypothetical protein